jgi:hypothetical protein
MQRLDIPEIAQRASRRGRKGRGKRIVDVRMSGRDGDYVYYMRGKKQCRRRYFVPRDPRTPTQLRYRAALGAASKKWSHSGELTEELRQACRLAGAKVRSRRRLGLSGRLTGQLYYVKRACAGGEGRRQVEEGRTAGDQPTAGQVRSPQCKGRSANGPRCGNRLHSRGRSMEVRSTWDEYRVATVLLPSQYRRGTVGGRTKAACGMRIGRGAGRHGTGHRRELWRGS